MKSTISLLALASASQALVTRGGSCSFHLTAHGGPGGPVGQLSDGQNRIGDKSLPIGQYSLGPNGILTDSKNRQCLLTPPTTQWQCDAGGKPTPGFSLGCDGTLFYKGSSKFTVCPTNNNEGWNFYSQPIKGEPRCVSVSLQADGCNSGCVTTSTTTLPCPTKSSSSCKTTSSSSSSCKTTSTSSSSCKTTSSSTSSSCSSTPTPKQSCPAYLKGDWEFPHLIVPIDSSKPTKQYGTSYNGTAGGSISSIFNFDIPSSYANKTCTLEFLFPTQSQLETSSYSISGDQTFSFEFLSGVASKQTSYSNAPQPEYNFGNFVLRPGSAVAIGSTPGGTCPTAGQTVSFLMSAVGRSAINYFQDSNPCPIGLYVTAK